MALAALNVPAGIAQRLRRPRSFAWHLAVLTIGLVVPALIFVGILLTRYGAAEKARIEDEAQGLARTLAFTVAQRLNEPITTLQALATSPSLARGEFAMFYQQIKALQEQQGQHYGLREPQGDLVLSTRVPFGQPIGGIEGAVRAADHAALKRRAPFISDVYVGPVSRVANITISVPVLQHDPPRFVVGASIDASVFTGLLKTVSRPESWSIGLTDRAFTVVARAPEMPNRAGRTASVTFQGEARRTQGMYYGTTSLGLPSLIAYDTVPGADWRVVVSVPEADITGLLKRSIVALLAVGASLGAIGAVLAWAMQKRMTASVAAVGSLAETFRERTPAASPPVAVSEIARVSEALTIAARELRENEARFRGVFESAIMGFTIFDANTGETVAINDCFLAMTGHDRADFEGGRWDWRDFTVPAFQHLDEYAIRQARERGWWDPYEKKYQRRDGSRFPVRLSSAPLPDQPGRVVVAIEDISVRRAVERDLRDSERRLQLAKQAAHFGVWDWNLETGAIAWSPEMFDILGLKAELPPEALFDSWVRILHPDDRDMAVGITNAAASTGEAFNFDIRILHGGGVRWVRSQGNAILGPDGRPKRLIGVNLDVTAQHEREEDLEREAARLAAAVEERTQERDRIFELSADLFAVMGFDGRIKVVNPAWSKLLGYSEADILARPVGDAVHPDDHERIGEMLATLRAGHPVQGFEDRLLTADGRVVWMSWTCVPETDETFYAVGRDVTKDREREESLRQSQKMEAVGQLTGGIAHDFNNLLGAMMSSFDLIRRKPDDRGRVVRMAENGLAAAERGAKLTSQLLAFSRSQKLELKPLRPADLIHGMHDMLARTLGPQVRIQLDLRTCEGVRSDATQLEMAILNLAINARDAMPYGGVLTLACRDRLVSDDPELPSGEYVELSITDTGVGMPPDVQARAFDPFFTTKGVGKGTGLGLSQVYGVAKQGGGAVRIDSKLGAGTTMRILLPRADMAVTTAAAGPTDAPSPDAVDATILIVDDDDDMRRMLKETLDTLGYRVLDADGGETALRILASSRPDAVILDFAMPVMNGAELAKAIRTDWPDAPIIFASGYSDTAAIEAAVGRPEHMLSKPFRIHDLQAVLVQALDQPR